MKTILIAIPTEKFIETETFKSIYDLIIPEGYDAHLLIETGNEISQIRNKICDWAITNNYEYVFCVDSDISFKPDTLIMMLNHNQSMVSGVYRQRLPNNIVEIYNMNLSHMRVEDVMSKSFQEIGACGFGCVLIKTDVMKTIGYPQFVYKSAIDHKNTFSEDVYFCKQAREKGYSIYCDSTIVCGHIGSYNYAISDIWNDKKIKETAELIRLRELRSMDLLPKDHFNFLKKLKSEGLEPKVIYDLGACVMHWTDRAKEVWSDSKYVLFEAMKAVEPIYQESGNAYCISILTDTDHKEINFYENTNDPGGNTYYKENPELSPRAEELFPESSIQRKLGYSLDFLVDHFDFPKPDLIKMDIQGAELDVLKGAENTLKNCKHIILELQHLDYNLGAPKKDEVIKYLEELGYKTDGMFCGSNLGVDGDYYFYKD